MEITFIATTILTSALIVATVIDIQSNRIPNGLVLIMLALGISIQFSLFGTAGLANSAAGIVVGGLLFMPLYIKGGMGAGDVKLAAAIGSFVGAKIVFVSVLYTLIIGGFLALIYLAINGNIKKFADRYYNMIALYYGTKKTTYIESDIGSVEKHRFPYALAISLGTLISLFQFHWL